MPRGKELNERMRAESRRQLMAAARHLFANQGYFTCKVSDIAREAGMSQGNLYWYFDGKEALLQAILAEGFAALEAMTAEVAAYDGPPGSILTVLFDTSLALYRDLGDFNTILLSLLAHGGVPLLLELGFDMLAIGSRYHGNLITVFERAREQRLVAEVDSNMLVMFYFAFFNGLAVTYAEDWKQLPDEALRSAMLRLLGASG